MRRLVRTILFVLVFGLAISACSDATPYCSAVVDATGRAVAACPNPRQDPVCDLPGDEAHFDEGPMGVTLMGALRAACNGDEVVVCPIGADAPAYCITDPEL